MPGDFMPMRPAQLAIDAQFRDVEPLEGAALVEDRQPLEIVGGLDFLGRDMRFAQKGLVGGDSGGGVAKGFQRELA